MAESRKGCGYESNGGFSVRQLMQGLVSSFPGLCWGQYFSQSGSIMYFPLGNHPSPEEQRVVTTSTAGMYPQENVLPHSKIWPTCMCGLVKLKVAGTVEVQ